MTARAIGAPGTTLQRVGAPVPGRSNVQSCEPQCIYTARNCVSPAGWSVRYFCVLCTAIRPNRSNYQRFFAICHMQLAIIKSGARDVLSLFCALGG